MALKDCLKYASGPELQKVCEPTTDLFLLLYPTFHIKLILTDTALTHDIKLPHFLIMMTLSQIITPSSEKLLDLLLPINCLH